MKNPLQRSCSSRGAGCVLVPAHAQLLINGAGATFPTRCTPSGLTSITSSPGPDQLPVHRLAAAAYANCRRARWTSAPPTAP